MQTGAGNRQHVRTNPTLDPQVALRGSDIGIAARDCSAEKRARSEARVSVSALHSSLENEWTLIY
jgi:hypothetical protein